jgi:DNA-binding MurR/RpiR family transcriptional regulator
MTDAPRDFAELKTRIAERAVTLPRRLTQVAQYALEFPDEIAFGTVASIAQSADVQPSALVRFAQTLGYQGFSDLQTVFRSRLRGQVENYQDRIAKLKQHGGSSTGPATVLSGFVEASHKSLNHLQEHTDLATLDEAVEKLAEADTIYLVGLRRSFPVATYLAYAFGQLSIRNRLIDATGGMALDAIKLSGTNDCLLAVSFTPYAPETIEIIKAATQGGTPIVAVTDSPLSPLATLANIWIEVQEANLEGFRSLTGTLTLAQTIAVAVANRKNRDSKN